MKPIRVVVSIIMSAMLLTACMSTKRIEQLDQARAEVAALSSDPLAQQAASQELIDARKSLEAADAALNKRDRDEALHYSYLASQQALTGQERIAAARAKEQIAQGEAERNRVLLESRTREAEGAKAAAEQQAQQADVARQQAEAAQRQLADLQAKQTDRGMVLTLGDVLFDTGAAKLKPGAASTIERVASFLKNNNDTKVIVEGHTDSRGSDEYNQQLSERRAQSVADALTFRGIDRSRIESTGRGKTLPVASNDTAVGRQQNRRVELIFSDTSGQFARGVSRP